MSLPTYTSETLPLKPQHHAIIRAHVYWNLTWWSRGEASVVGNCGHLHSKTLTMYTHTYVLSTLLCAWTLCFY